MYIHLGSLDCSSIHAYIDRDDLLSAPPVEGVNVHVVVGETGDIVGNWAIFSRNQVGCD